MEIQNTITSRTSVALTKEATANLKLLTKDNTLKMYEMMAALIDLAVEDEDVFKRAVNLGKKTVSLKNANREIFSQKISKLPVKLQKKLKSMSTDELAALLEKAGL